MALIFLKEPSRLRLKVSAAFWLQSGACAVVAWSLLHGGSASAPAARTAGENASAGAGVVSYASSCGFRGHHVPHLVLQTESGPVTVMVLVHEHASGSTQFDEQGYRGVIVPVPGHGSLAVLTRGPAADAAMIASIAQRVLDSIVWTG